MMFVFNEPMFVIRSLKKEGSRKVYLTFDDGPSEETTPHVLDLLKKYNCHATFFVIGHLANTNRSLIKRIQSEGHSVMSHSIDHSYSIFFKNSKKIEKWIQSSLDQLNEISQSESYFFRPPAGILNPPLLKAAKKLKTPLILWNHRFFDSLFCLTKKKIDLKIKRITAGDIILLHDRQKTNHQKEFLLSLEHLLINLEKINLKSSPINKLDIDSINWR